MADTMYAWSRIVYGAEKDDDGNVTGQLAVEPGDEVSQSDLDISDEEWQNLIDQEVVREYPLTDDLKDPFRSPRQLMQDKLTAAQQGYDISGPTADLVKRFDDEGEIKDEETLAQERDQEYQDQIKAGQEADKAAESAPAKTTTTSTPSAPSDAG